MIQYNKIILTIIFLSLPIFAVSAPDIDSISYDGTTLVVNSTATNFGSNAAVGTSNLQDTHANIEAGTPDGVFTQSGWGVEVTEETDTQIVPRYSTVESHSGSQSIVTDYDHEGVLNRFRGHFYYDFSTSITRVYVTFWVNASYRDATGGQWKIWRINDVTDFQNGSLDFMQNAFHPDTAGGNNIGNFYRDPSLESFWDCDGCPYESAGQYISADEVAGPNAVQDRWVRMEYWIDTGTRNTNDGTFFYKFHDPNNPVTPVIKDIDNMSFTNLLILLTGETETWSVTAFGGASTDGLDMLVYWDDVFVQVGSWARVEIGNASTWSAVTHTEIQKPTGWESDGSEITVGEVNQGSLPNGDAWVFVFDGSGVNNATGQLITFGTSSTSSNVGGGPSISVIGPGSTVIN